MLGTFEGAKRNDTIMILLVFELCGSLGMLISFISVEQKNMMSCLENSE